MLIAFDAEVTPQLAQQILALPVLAPAGTQSLVSLYRAMCPEMRQGFHAAVAQDAGVTSLWASLKADFAGLNGLEAWPYPADLDIVEAVWVEADPVTHLIFTTEGRRYAKCTTAAGIRLLTFPEFRATYGRSVGSHINSLAYDRVRRMQRALELLQLEQPYEVHVQFASAAGVLEKDMQVYDEAQPVEYASRHHMVCCAIDGEIPCPPTSTK